MLDENQNHIEDIIVIMIIIAEVSHAQLDYLTGKTPPGYVNCKRQIGFYFRKLAILGFQKIKTDLSTQGVFCLSSVRNLHTISMRIRTVLRARAWAGFGGCPYHCEVVALLFVLMLELRVQRLGMEYATVG